MDKQKQGSGTTRNGSKRSPSDKKTAGSEQPPAEMDMDVLARGLDHVLQKQLNDKLKNGTTAEQEVQADAETTERSEVAAQNAGQSDDAPVQTEVIVVEKVESPMEDEAGYLASLSVLATMVDEVEQAGSALVAGESGEATAVAEVAETPAEAVVAVEAEQEASAASEPVLAVAEDLPETVEQVLPESAGAEAAALNAEPVALPESVATEPELPVTESVAVEELPQVEVAVVTEEPSPVVESAPPEPVLATEEAAVAEVEAVAPVLMEPLSGSVVAERKLEMAKLADGFSEMARNKAKMADADSQDAVAETAAAELAVPVTEAAEEADLAGTVEVPAVEEAPKPFPHKAPYVAAAEKERVLQMIRDAASKKLDEGYKMRGVQVMAKTEPAPTEAVTESPLAETVEEPVVVVAEESVVAVEALESATAAVAPEAVTAEDQATDSTAEEPAPEELSAAAIVAEAVSSAPAPVEEDNAASQAQQTTVAEEGDETVQPMAPGGLVPPSPRTATPSLRQKQETVPTPNQAKAIEAFLRQLQGESVPAEEPVAPVAAVQVEDLPEVEALEQEQAEPAQATAAQSGTRRRSSRDSDDVVPVESLGTGIYNALGDMVGSVVHTSKRVTGKVKKVVPPPVQEPEEELPPPRPTGTSRAADRLAGGVRGLAGGVTDIVKGSGNVVLGTVGIVVMPVVGAVGELYRAFKPVRKDSSTKK